MSCQGCIRETIVPVGIRPWDARAKQASGVRRTLVWINVLRGFRSPARSRVPRPLAPCAGPDADPGCRDGPDGRRVRAFVQRGISSKAELDSADAALKVADGRYQDAIEEVRNRQALLTQRKTELDQARQEMVDSILLAPFPGIIRERTGSPGQYVNAGAPIATLVRMHPLRLQADVPEREASNVKAGQEVKVRVEGDVTVYAGRVVRVSPAIDEQSRSLRIEAQVGNEAATIRPGSFATGEIIIAASTPAIVVPTSAIVSFAGVEKVLTVAD